MMNTTTESIPGKTISKMLGIAKGSTIRTKHLGRDIMAGLKHFIGGELRGYTEMLNEAREEALSRMNDQAKKLGADAVVNVRFVTAEVMQGAAEVLAYGTAVKIKK